MSRRDIHHDLMKAALIADGWRVTHDPYIFDSDPQLATDLGADRVIAAELDRRKIAIEVKSFVSESQVSELEKALGQYGLYRRLLRTQEPDRELVLAVPTYAFEDIFQRQVGIIAREEFDLQIVVFDFNGELTWQT